MNCFRFVSVFLSLYFGQFICCLVVSTAISCLERLVSKMTYYVLSGTINATHLFGN